MIHPPHWKPGKGYANGVLATGTTLFLGGQIGWNAEQRFESDDFVAQTEQALRNVATLVREAGGTTNDIVRLTWYITDKTQYLSRQKELGGVYRKVMDKHFPAMTMVVVAGLIEDRALVEIEAIAVIETT